MPTPSPLPPPPVYFRALVNFTHSIDYSPRLEDANSDEFREVSEAVVDTVSGARQGGTPSPGFGGGHPRVRPHPLCFPCFSWSQSITRSLGTKWSTWCSSSEWGHGGNGEVWGCRGGLGRTRRFGGNGEAWGAGEAQEGWEGLRCRGSVVGYGEVGGHGRIWGAEEVWEGGEVLGCREVWRQREIWG